MGLKQNLGKVYRWGLRTFIYNDINSALFFKNGYRKKINDKKILVPFKFSWVYPNEYEVDKTDFIKIHCKEGNVVFDIGAHMGVFSYFLACQVGKTGKVFSFEPAPLTYKMLQHTIAYNHLENTVEANQMAMAEKAGELTFYIYSNSKISSGNSLSPLNPAGTSHGITVKTVTLDDFFEEKKLSRLDFIKIDAEGAELEILKGGQKTIRQYKPYITLEVHPRVFVPSDKIMIELFDLIVSMGYTISKNKKIIDEREFCNHIDCFEVVLTP
ncbi:FkbM family methyltransferase [Ferruginibacter sp.]